MLEFIKMFGLGMLYTLLLPFIVVIFALYLVYVFCNYLVLEVINIFGFFFGYTFSTETELEKKLNDVKARNNGGHVTSDDLEIEDFEGFFIQEDTVEELKGSDNNE